MRSDLLVGGGEQVGTVGDDVQPHRAFLVELDAPEVPPGEHR
jgi:hypothetical protein